ncbi:hypothetical protein SAV31267_080060 [Streptomyces avermitilis]|uniref:Uncharacterized protein n=1 Tax=Streptomyces avermitilis TaxID=33903 RepID=A0A4D4N1Z2_STRAX|nr:hypothetical protein SAVMC3_19830 [Streptomyces avermitilis]GDY78521.1 hypothetical protein SAV31267_080060 [Streptomyces avermitilis]
MVGDRGHQSESSRQRSVHVRFGGQYQNSAVFSRTVERRNQPVQRALEGLQQGHGRQEYVRHGGQDGPPAAVRGESGGQHHESARDKSHAGGTAKAQPAREARQELGERPGVRQVGESLGRAVRPPRLARQ